GGPRHFAATCCGSIATCYATLSDAIYNLGNARKS
ncbi:unnamed protein product, partial [Brassica rapa]